MTGTSSVQTENMNEFTATVENTSIHTGIYMLDHYGAALLLELIK